MYYTMKTLNVIIPMHNEGPCIGELISGLKAVLGERLSSYKIIPVDDGSSDNTKAVLDSESIPYVSHKVRKGYGASIKHAMDFSEGELICIIDGDLAYSPQDIIPLLQYVDSYDMVIGARIKKWAERPPLIYRLSKFFICGLLGLIFRQKVYDINSGLRIMKKTIINRYMHILPDGFSFTATMTFAMMFDGYRIKYAPIDYHKREGKSKIKKFTYALNFIRSYLRVVLNKIKNA